MRAQVKTDMSMEGVPLTLAPLLSAYGRHRRISLRIENLPERARLSRGRNNGDRSWSLMRDELEDLVYLPPQGSDAAHTVSVRIINLESGNGETLALHDLDIEPAGGQPRANGKTAAHASSAELRKLREELASTKASLRASQRALTEEQAGAAQARAEAAQSAAALDEARAQFESNLMARLAAVESDAAARIDANRAAWAQEQNRRLHESEARAQQRLEEARACWLQESEAALANARLDWKSEEAVRLAEAEKQWRIRTNRALAEAEERWQRAHATAADARAQSAIEIEKRVREEAEAALAKARDAWKSEETARLAAAEAEWRARSDCALSEAMEELERVKSELSRAKATLGARERELAIVADAAAKAQASKHASLNIDEARKAWEDELAQRLADADAMAKANLETARAAWVKETQEKIAASEKNAGVRLEDLRSIWQAEMAAALAQAREAWAMDEAARLVAAESKWRDDTERALDQLRRQQSVQQTRDVSVDLSRWEIEIAKLNEALAARESELAGARSELEQSRAVWSAEEAARLKAAEARWREESERAMELLRREQVESSKPARNEASGLRRIDAELEDLRSALERRDRELYQARGEVVRVRERWKADLERTLEVSKQAWQAEEEQRLKLARAEWEREQRDAYDAATESDSSEPRLHRRYFRDGVVGILLAAAAVFIYWQVMPAVTANTYPQTTPVTATYTQPSPKQPPRTAVAAAQMMIVVHGVNLRAAASPSAAVVATLARGTRVALMERQKDWIRVRVDTAAGKAAREGWVFDSYLKNDNNDD